MKTEKQFTRRLNFIKQSRRQTKKLHWPLRDKQHIQQANGALNHAGHGHAAAYSFFRRSIEDHGLKAYLEDIIKSWRIPYAPWGQSTVAFSSAPEYKKANETNEAYGGSAEYGIVRTAEVQRVCNKMQELHEAAGACMYGSGLQAITDLLTAFPEDRNTTILLPDSCYGPTKRALKEEIAINFQTYPADSNMLQIRQILSELEQAGQKPGMIYFEAPSSLVFKIPEIRRIARHARERGIKTAMDNTWASHRGCKPIPDLGIDFVIQATTKYEGGYGDTPSGFILFKNKEDHEKLKRKSRILGHGAIDPARCNRLYYRLDSLEKRMAQQEKNALHVIEWLNRQSFVKDILYPALPSSPGHERFKKYFKRANGLFTIMFEDGITQKHAENFMQENPLALIGDSWGGHITLISPVTTEQKNIEMRISIGLEHPKDILRAFEIAAPALLSLSA